MRNEGQKANLPSNVRSSRAARRILERVSWTRLRISTLEDGKNIPDFSLIAETILSSEF